MNHTYKARATKHTKRNESDQFYNKLLLLNRDIETVIIERKLQEFTIMKSLEIIYTKSISQ